jgi:leucyl aminopeptidase (aminopeptidase T)
MSVSHEELKFVAQSALEKCLRVESSDSVLIVCDPPCLEIGQAFWQAASDMVAEAVLVQIKPRKQSGNEPPEPVGKWFSQFSVGVMPTSKSLTHTQARRSACENGSRIATLPGVTIDMFMRTMKTDWQALSERTKRIALDMSGASRVRIVSEKGTDFTFATGGRTAKPDDGLIGTPGSYGNLPAGEGYLAPLEGTGNGRLVFDGSFPMAGILSEPLILEVAHGLVTNVSGHPVSQKLMDVFATYGEDARNIAEFGVGTLDTAQITGLVLEDEKVQGTIHVAIGDNASMGGTVHVPVHLDGVMKEPTVYLDDKLWMKKGVVL